MPASVKFRIKGSKVYVSPVNTYDATSTKKRSKGWGAINGGPNVPAQNLPELRNRARDAVRNDGIADSAVDTIVTNVIGTGIKPHFSTSDDGLNRDLAEIFDLWCAEAHVSGQLDYYGLQALAVRSTVEAGENFGRLRLRAPSDGLSVPLQIQLLESEFCPAEKNEMNGKNDIISGIEFAPFGLRTAYWFHDRHPYDLATVRQAGTGLPRRIPADRVFHLMQVRRPGQVRGEPWLTRAIVKLNELHSYDDAELVRKKTGAMFAGFRRRPLPESVTAEELAEIWGDDAEAEDGVGHVTLEPGTMQELDPGEDIEFSSPVDVGGNYEAFMRGQHRALARSAHVLYEQVTGDYSAVNDRTLRAAINEFRRSCRMWQHHLVVFQMCRPVINQWRTLARFTGVITPPRGMSELDFARVRHVPQGWEYLHPVQDVEAKIKSVRAGFESRADVVTARGGDVQQVDAEQAADNARADGLGISHDSDGRRSASDPSKSADEALDGNPNQGN